MIQSITDILRTLTEAGFSPLNMVLICMLYFLGAYQGLFPKFWGKKENGEENIPTIVDLYRQMTDLKQYFNHETTDRLDKLIVAQEKTLQHFEKLNDSMTGIHTQHKIWNEAGIPTRGCITKR